MLFKCTAACLLALAVFSSFCDGQLDIQQSRQVIEPALTWKFPVDPQVETPGLPTSFEIREPVAVSTVAVDCRENFVHVEVKKDMFGIGQFIDSAGLTLGDCAVTTEDSSGQVFIFENELHNCGSELTMTEDSFIYSYVVNYNPQTHGETPVIRTSKAAVIVECHYPRKHNVSSLPLDPLWIPFSAVKAAEEFLYFSLKLMTDDWMHERPSSQYFLGDVIHVEATVMQFFHVPLRVYVDSCVATLLPDVNSSPRYAFIDNHGCFIDSRVTPSSSTFMSRTAENKLRFQLEAFRFQGAESGQIYITCHLKATTTAHSIHELHRSCSFTSNMWREVNGADAACGSSVLLAVDMGVAAALAQIKAGLGRVVGLGALLVVLGRQEALGKVGVQVAAVPEGAKRPGLGARLVALGHRIREGRVKGEPVGAQLVALQLKALGLLVGVRLVLLVQGVRALGLPSGARLVGLGHRIREDRAKGVPVGVRLVALQVKALGLLVGVRLVLLVQGVRALGPASGARLVALGHRIREGWVKGEPVGAQLVALQLKALGLLVGVRLVLLVQGVRALGLPSGARLVGLGHRIREDRAKGVPVGVRLVALQVKALGLLVGVRLVLLVQGVRALGLPSGARLVGLGHRIKEGRAKEVPVGARLVALQVKALGLLVGVRLVLLVQGVRALGLPSGARLVGLGHRIKEGRAKGVPVGAQLVALQVKALGLLVGVRLVLLVQGVRALGLPSGARLVGLGHRIKEGRAKGVPVGARLVALLQVKALGLLVGVRLVLLVQGVRALGLPSGAQLVGLGHRIKEGRAKGVPVGARLVALLQVKALGLLVGVRLVLLVQGVRALGLPSGARLVALGHRIKEGRAKGVPVGARLAALLQVKALGLASGARLVALGHRIREGGVQLVQLVQGFRVGPRALASGHRNGKGNSLEVVELAVDHLVVGVAAGLTGVGTGIRYVTVMKEEDGDTVVTNVQRHARDVSKVQSVVWEGTVTLGPMGIREKEIKA
uniref:Zona pellucida sperm-binding protein 3 n=1 Tax=Knipowitschia caucasica TaxID=637954 RepID=A0AAV2KRA9_KNICA